MEYLHSKGSGISSDPNAKLSDEEYALVAKAFSSDSQVKKESSSIDLKNARKKKETVSIDASGNVSTENKEAPAEEFISIKDEVKLENKIKIIDHIDLNPERPKVQQETPKTHKDEEQEAQPQETASPAAEEKETEQKQEAEARPDEAEVPEETPFKVAQPALKEVKVVGTIDLDAINQRTRDRKSVV